MASKMLRVFRWTDFLTFGCAALGATLVSILVALTPQDLPWTAFRVAPVVGVPGAFWAAYIGLLLWRRSVFADAAYELGRYPVALFRSGSQNIPLPADLEREIDRVLILWMAVWRHEKDLWKKSPLEVINDGFYLFWKEKSFERDDYAGPLSGYTVAYKRLIQIGHADFLPSSSLGHEMGHLILFWGRGSRFASEQFLKEYAVPIRRSVLMGR